MLGQGAGLQLVWRRLKAWLQGKGLHGARFYGDGFNKAEIVLITVVICHELRFFRYFKERAFLVISGGVYIEIMN